MYPTSESYFIEYWKGFCMHHQYRYSNHCTASYLIYSRDEPLSRWSRYRDYGSPTATNRNFCKNRYKSHPRIEFAQYRNNILKSLQTALFQRLDKSWSHLIPLIVSRDAWARMQHVTCSSQSVSLVNLIYWQRYSKALFV